MQPAASSRSVRVVKTFLSSLTALLLTAGFLLIGSPAHADVVIERYDNVAYLYNTEQPEVGVRVTAYNGPEGGDMNIRSFVQIAGALRPVVGIAWNLALPDTLGHVSIPNSVTEIGNNAFAGTTMTGLTLGHSIATIGGNAFSQTGLTRLTLPDSVTEIGRYAFGDNQLTHVTIPNSLTTISENLFSGNNLSSITFGNSVTTISAGAFRENDLTSLQLPNSVTEIGGGAFRGNNLTDLTIPNSVTNIGWAAFENNDITSLNLGNSVTTIGGNTFRGNNFTKVTIPSSVTSIETQAFEVDSLESVTFAGNAPTIIAAGAAGTFGPAVGKTLRYYSTATGFTSPTWQGYATEEIPVMRTVTFDPRGGSATASAEVKHGSRLAPPAEPTRTGYTFTGWYTNSNATGLYDFDATVTGTFTLYAGWELNNYTVTFDTGDGSAIAPVAVAHGNTLTLPAAPTRTGYTFAGWYTYTDGLTRFDPDEPITGSVTLFALWSLNTYTVNFDTGGGNSVAPVSIDHGESLTPPADPVKYGHTFAGWFTDADATTEFNFDEPVTEALTLYAGWELNNYSITLDLGDGSPATTVTLNHGDTLPRPADPVREGHTFTGWFITPATATAASFNSATAGTFAFTSAADGVLYDFDTPVTGPITLYAGWSLNSYTVSFDTGDGSAVDPIQVNYGDTFPIPADPTRAGYSFTGWFTDPETTTAYDRDAPITGELTLYAGWEKIVESAAKTDETKTLSATGTTGPSGLLGAGFLAAIAGLLVIRGRRRLTAGS